MQLPKFYVVQAVIGWNRISAHVKSPIIDPADSAESGLLAQAICEL